MGIRLGAAQMSRLYLHCVICDRQQADGLLSGAAWGRLDLPTGTDVQHPALKGSQFRACPTCIERHPDWQNELLASFGVRTPDAEMHAGHGP